MSKPKELEILICSKCGRPGSVFNLPGSICNELGHAGDWERKVVPVEYAEPHPYHEEHLAALNRLAEWVYGENPHWTSADTLVDTAIRRMGPLAPDEEHQKQWRKERGYT